MQLLKNFLHDLLGLLLSLLLMLLPSIKFGVGPTICARSTLKLSIAEGMCKPVSEGGRHCLKGLRDCCLIHFFDATSLSH